MLRRGLPGKRSDCSVCCRALVLIGACSRFGQHRQVFECSCHGARIADSIDRPSSATIALQKERRKPMVTKQKSGTAGDSLLSSTLGACARSLLSCSHSARMCACAHDEARRSASRALRYGYLSQAVGIGVLRRGEVRGATGRRIDIAANSEGATLNLRSCWQEDTSVGILRRMARRMTSQRQALKLMCRIGGTNVYCEGRRRSAWRLKELWCAAQWVKDALQQMDSCLHSRCGSRQWSSWPAWCAPFCVDGGLLEVLSPPSCMQVLH